MKKFFFVIGCCWLVAGSYGQDVSQRLQKAYQLFEADSQLKHAVSSLYVIDANTGVVVVDKNAQVGLAPASTQKIITSVTAFELLGKDYRYKTELGYTGDIIKETLNGDLFLQGSGDPTLGSWRYESTKDSIVLSKWSEMVKKTGIRNIKGAIVYNYKNFSANVIPGGWIWQDIGNYYGAAPDVLNWKENQYDILLKSGNDIGSNVEILGNNSNYTNELKAAAKGTGDNAYVYLPSNNDNPLISGTIPINEKAFKITASDPFSIQHLLLSFGLALNRQGIRGKDLGSSTRYYMINQDKKSRKVNIIYTHYSPTLDSIIYWFNKKSINLYGEALVKTFAYEKQGFGSTDSGVAIVKRFWKEKGLDEGELNMYDGSGLSPLNRVTTHAQVEILKYAKTRDWYPYFYDALPEYNAMKMKSGTISDVKGFCGYHKSKEGKEYIFSFLVNNYSGRSADLVSKMYKVLNELK
ncbi:MAG TPA: D-alanyl-D-alanine carboxypeptidase/D-alanyl-D-alanine-endopeptidase [Chitinophagaceae bacterium]